MIDVDERFEGWVFLPVVPNRKIVGVLDGVSSSSLTRYLIFTVAVVFPPSSSMTLFTFGFVSFPGTAFTGTVVDIASVLSGICAMDGAITVQFPSVVYGEDRQRARDLLLPTALQLDEVLISATILSIIGSFWD